MSDAAAAAPPLGRAARARDAAAPGHAAPARPRDTPAAWRAAGESLPRRVAVDAALALTIPLAFLVLALALDWGETLRSWLDRHEAWQADEALLGAFSLALSALWFGWRRWRDLGRELARRGAAQAEAHRLLEGNRALARALIDAQEAERRALARELHDELGQTCTALRIEMTLLTTAVPAGSVAAACATRSRRLAEQLHGLVRDLLGRLRPGGLDELGLAAAAEGLCLEWQSRSGVRCEFETSGVLEALGEARNVALYRFVQEGLANAMNHAQASRLRVALRRSPAQVEATVDDDGNGFCAPRTGGLGLAGMTERAAALGGTLRVDTAPGRGTRLTMCLPLADGPATAGAMP